METFAFIGTNTNFIYTMLTPSEQRQAINKLLKSKKILINENLKKKYDFKQSTGRLILAIDELAAPKLLLNCAFVINLNILELIKATQYNKQEVISVLNDKQDQLEALKALEFLINKLGEIEMYNFQKLIISKNISINPAADAKINRLITSGGECKDCNKKKQELEAERKRHRDLINATIQPKRPPKSGKTIIKKRGVKNGK